MAKLKILLICGHGASDPGACSSYGIERDETRKVVAELVNQFKNYNDVEVSVYPTNRNAYTDVVNGWVQVNFANYDYVFEVHFNSATASANGVEVWVTPTEQGTTVEQKIVNKVANLGFTNRGVKREYFAVITNAKNKGTSSALIETCFMSNQRDMELYRNKFKQICGAMVEGIAEGFGLNKKESSQPQPSQPSGDLCRIIVNGSNKIALTGLQKCIDHVKDNYPKDEVKIQRVSDNKILWTQAKYVAPQPTMNRYAEDGIFTFSTAVTVRTAAEENAKTNAVYYPGESVIYHHVIVNKNGFNWIEYARNNGTTGYLKVKDLSTGESYGHAR